MTSISDKTISLIALVISEYMSKKASKRFVLITMCFVNIIVKFYQFKHKLVLAFKWVVLGDMAHAFLPYHCCTESNEIGCLDFPYTLMHQNAMIISAEKMFIIKYH